MDIKKISGYASLYNAFAYIIGILFFAIILKYQELNSSQERFSTLLINFNLAYIIHSLIYIVFGISLLILVLGLYKQLKKKDSLLLNLGTLFGIFWSFAVILTGIIFNVSQNFLKTLYIENPELAITIFSTVELIRESLGGGSEILGGIWILCISIITLKEKFFSKSLSYFGILIGVVGILSDLPNFEIFTMIFGLTQIIWFILIGISLIRK